jgi:hypothetical protein
MIVTLDKSARLFGRVSTYVFRFIMTFGPSPTEFLTSYQLYADPEERLLLCRQPECGFALQVHDYDGGGAGARLRRARRWIMANAQMHCDSVDTAPSIGRLIRVIRGLRR